MNESFLEKSVHGKNELFECPTCGRTFEKVEEYYLHFWWGHKNFEVKEVVP